MPSDEKLMDAGEILLAKSWEWHPEFRIGECWGFCSQIIPGALQPVCEMAEADGQRIGFCRSCLLRALSIINENDEEDKSNARIDGSPR